MTYDTRDARDDDANDRMADDHWPHSEDAEGSLLGSLLIDGSAVTRIRRRVRAEDCHIEGHRLVLQAMFDMTDADTPIDLVTLIEHLRRRKLLDEVGGASAVSALTNQVPTSANIEAYADDVANTAGLRRLLAASAKIAALAVHEPDARVAFQKAQAVVQQVVAGSLFTQEGGRFYGELLDLFFADLLDRMEQPAAGILTDLTSLDIQLGGFEPGDLIYLCGRPGSGKSALGVALATGIARRFYAQWCERQTARTNPDTGEVFAPETVDETRPGVVDIVTLEMRDLHQVRRIVAASTNVNTRILRAAFKRPDGSIDVEAYQTVRRRAFDEKVTLESTLHIDEQPTTMEKLRADVLMGVATRNTQVVVIDQLDLISDEPTTGRARADETQRITRFSRMLKQLALEANVVIICLAQLNRNVEQRQNKRPMLSDLRSSGQLEQDADIVLGLYRGAYYDSAHAQKDVAFAQFAELALLKVRDGEAGIMTPLRFEGPYARFTEWPHDWEWPADESRGMEG